MKTIPLLTCFVAVTAFALTAQSSAAPETSEPTPPGQAEPVKDVFPRWSVAGEWRVTHPDWTDVVTLKADGTMVTSRQGTTGRWILTGDAGTPLLIFRWDLFGTESLAMVALDHFRGQKRNGRFIDMRRNDDAPKAL